MKDIFKITASTLSIVFIFFLCFCCVLFCFIGLPAGIILGSIGTASMNLVPLEGKISSLNKILYININGIILSDKPINDPFGILSIGGVYAEDIEKIVSLAAKEENLKAIFLEVNSPGGSVYAAQRITNAISNLKTRKNIPVHSYITEMGASAAYYIVSISDKIYSSSSSLIGSIGVILGTFPVFRDVNAMEGIFTNGGVKFYTFSAGKGKDFGNPFRDPTNEEIKHYNSILNNTYQDFISFISTNRNIPKNKIENEIGALIFDGISAKENKLIDEISTQEQSLENLLSRIGVSGDDYLLIGSQQYSNKHYSNLINLVVSILKNFNRTDSMANCQIEGILSIYGDINKYCK